MTMWLFKCRSCRHLLGPGEDVMVNGRYYHGDCAPTDDEAEATEDWLTELEVDRRIEERHV